MEIVIGSPQHLVFPLQAVDVQEGAIAAHEAVPGVLDEQANFPTLVEQCSEDLPVIAKKVR
jgi:hypothetical protein